MSTCLLLISLLHEQWRFSKICWVHGRLGYQTPPLSNFKKIALAPHDYAGNIYLIWFVNCKTIEINLCDAVNFPEWLIWAINTTQTIRKSYFIGQNSIVVRKKISCRWWRILIANINKFLLQNASRGRSSRLQMIFKIDVLKDFAIFTGKHLCWSFYLITLLTLRSTTLLGRDSITGVFLCGILSNF